MATSSSEAACGLPRPRNHASAAWKGSLFWLKPTGISRSMEWRSFFAVSPSIRSAGIDVFRAIIPQPMSTPTAAGQIAPFVATTLPTVAPIPRWTSAMAATCLKTKGSDAVFFNWSIASGSIQSVQTLTGTRALRVSFDGHGEV